MYLKQERPEMDDFEREQKKDKIKNSKYTICTICTQIIGVDFL